MFGLVEASAWMHVRNGTFKMSEQIGSESDSVPALFAYFLYWFRESKVADKAKHQAMRYQTATTSADEPKKQLTKDFRYAFPQRTMETSQKR